MTACGEIKSQAPSLPARICLIRPPKQQKSSQMGSELYRFFEQLLPQVATDIHHQLTKVSAPFITASVIMQRLKEHFLHLWAHLLHSYFACFSRVRLVCLYSVSEALLHEYPLGLTFSFMVTAF
jgi:hypothetical protein